MQPHPRSSRRAFTLIEVLVVIGIILVLLGIAVLAYRHVEQTAAKNDTVSQLKIAQGMLAEYEKNAGLKEIETTDNQATVPGTPPPGAFPVYQDKVGNGQLIAASIVLADDMGSVSDDTSSGSPRYVSRAVQRTQDVMYVLLRVPANRTTAANAPAKRILEGPPKGNSANPPSFPISQAVLLDGWRNPIIFVPRGGIHVRIANPADPSAQGIEYIVRTSGTFPASQLAQHPLSSSDRPFFASAGQDGDFSKGDDNVYSFQN